MTLARSDRDRESVTGDAVLRGELVVHRIPDRPKGIGTRYRHDHDELLRVSLDELSQRSRNELVVQPPR
jgi:hypothetical protein